MVMCCVQLCQDEESDGEENLCLNPQDAERFRSSQTGLLRVKIRFCCHLSNQIQLLLLCRGRHRLSVLLYCLASVHAGCYHWSTIDPKTWEDVACKRSKWRKACFTGVQHFEDVRIAKAEKSAADRKVLWVSPSLQPSPQTVQDPSSVTTAVDNSPQELASSVTQGFTGSSGRPELIRHPDGRLHHIRSSSPGTLPSDVQLSDSLAVFRCQLKSHFLTVFLTVQHDIILA